MQLKIKFVKVYWLTLVALIVWSSARQTFSKQHTSSESFYF